MCIFNYSSPCVHSHIYCAGGTFCEKPAVPQFTVKSTLDFSFLPAPRPLTIVVVFQPLVRALPLYFICKAHIFPETRLHIRIASHNLHNVLWIIIQLHVSRPFSFHSYTAVPNFISFSFFFFSYGVLFNLVDTTALVMVPEFRFVLLI